MSEQSGANLGFEDMLWVVVDKLRSTMDAAEDKPGFCQSASLEDIRKHHHVLTLGRYVGSEAIEDDSIPFEEKLAELADRLEQKEEVEELFTIKWRVL